MMDPNDFDVSQKVWVGNLPHEAASEDLETHFRQIGDPLLCLVVRPGVGCICYATAEEAATAISAYNGSEIGGSAIETGSWAKKGVVRPTATSLAGGKGGAKGGAKGPDSFHQKGGWKGGAPQMAKPSAWPGPSGPMKGGGGMCGKGGGWGWQAPQPSFGGGYGQPQPSAAADSWDEWGSSKKKKKSGGGGGGGAGAAGAASWTSGGMKTGWIMVDDTSTLVVQGLPPEAPAVVWEKGLPIFSSSSYLLSELVGDSVASQVEITHDPDWENFPEVAEACKVSLQEENCFAVATWSMGGVWAVGVASGWKGREAAVRVALALAIVAGDPSKMPKLQKNYPEFVALCRQGGLNRDGAAAPMMAMPAVLNQGAKAWGKSAWPGNGGAAGGKGGNGGAKAEPAEPAEIPALHLIALPPDSPTLLENTLPPEGPAIMHSGKNVKQYFSIAHALLSEFIEDMTDVTYTDDSEGTELVDVTAAWVAASGGEEVTACIARCASMACWGAGMAWGKKNRELAAKMALAIALGQMTGRLEELAANPDYADLAPVLVNAGMIDPPAKKRKIGEE